MRLEFLKSLAHDVPKIKQQYSLLAVSTSLLDKVNEVNQSITLRDQMTSLFCCFVIGNKFSEHISHDIPRLCMLEVVN